MRKIQNIKILSTFVDKMDDVVFLSKAIESGANIFRQTMGYKTREIHSKRMMLIKDLAKEKNKQIEIMHDYPGERPRLGTFDGVFDLNKYNKIVLSTNSDLNVKKNEIILPLNFKRNIFDKIQKNHRLLLKDGLVELEVTNKDESNLYCKLNKCFETIRFHAGINLPDTDVIFDCIGKLEDDGLSISAKENPEYIALSYVNTKEDILKARDIIKKSNPNCNSKIIAKIESRQAVDNFDSILDVADGIMVARGCLALQTSFEEIGLIQTICMAKSKKKKKIAIVATQMIDSMRNADLPLRAEVVDITNAILQGSIAVWLSPELANSDNYFKALNMLKKIINKVKYYV